MTTLRGSTPAGPLRVLRTRVALVLSILVGACAPSYNRTEITGVTPSRLGGSVSKTSIEVPEGLVVKAHIVAYNDDNKPISFDITQADSSIVDIATLVSESDFAFVGLRVGRTRIDIRAEGQIVLSLDANVVPQPEAYSR